MVFFKNKNFVNKELFVNNELLLNELKCISCKKYMASPIHQCFQGHSLCGNCAAENICSNCKSGMSTIRNIHLENIAFKVKYPCENLGNGCKSMFLYSELHEHQVRCGQRFHRCLLSGGHCTSVVKRSEMVAHVNFAHSREKVILKDSTFSCHNFKDATSHVRLISAYKEVFWYYYENRGNTAFWAIQYLGPDINCSNYSYDFKIHHSDDKTRYICFSNIECLKNNDDVDSYIVRSLVHIKMADIENYLSENGTAIFSLKIHKNKLKQKKEK